MKPLIYIPTSGRQDRQITIKSLPERWIKRTVLVVHKSEMDNYKSLNIPFIAHDVVGIGCIRHFITSLTLCDKIIMIDDDLDFYIRKEDSKLRRATQDEVGDGLDMILSWLDKEDIAQTGFSLSLLNVRKPYDVCYNEKCHAVSAIDVGIYREAGIRYDALPMNLEDLHVTLAFLEKGYRVKISYQYAFKDVQPKKNKLTGCSVYRNEQTELEACQNLQRLHPDYVSILTRKPKNETNNLYNRKNVPMVRWKKAYENSRRVHTECK